MIPKLTENVAIHQTLPVRPNLAGGYSSFELQQLFDKGAERIKTYVNDTLLPYLEASGAVSIGNAPLTDESGSTVAAQLSYVLSQIQGVSQGGIADGAVTEPKLADDLRGYIKRDLAMTVYGNPGNYAFTVPRTGKYLVCLVGGGGGREGFRRSSDDLHYEVCAPTAGGVAFKLLSLGKDTYYNIAVGAGGKGSAAPASEGSGGATSGGTTSFGQLFSATGGNRSVVASTPMSQNTVGNPTVGKGVGGDINLKSGATSLEGRVVSDQLLIYERRSFNMFSSGYEDSMSVADAHFPGGAPGGAWGGVKPSDGADGGNGMAVILYLGAIT